MEFQKRPEDFLVKMDLCLKNDKCTGILNSLKVYIHPDDMAGVECADSSCEGMLQRVAAWAYNLGYEKGGGRWA